MVWRERAFRTDIQIQETVTPWLPNSVCILAMGSYGRKEMSPFSDADILVLVPEEKSKNDTGLYDLLCGLHDAHERISIVSRTVTECIGMERLDIRSWFSLLEARPIFGDIRLFSTLVDALRNQIRRGGVETFQYSLTDHFARRGEKYGDSSRLLEPNIKNSGGGLRDIHAMYYAALLVRLAYESFHSEEAPPDFPASLAYLDISNERKEQVVEAWKFILDVREQMHEEVGHLHDLLEYDLQRTVAERLGFGSRNETKSVEAFMFGYYQHTRVLRGTHEILFANHTTPQQEHVNLDAKYYSVGRFLHLREPHHGLGGEEVLWAWMHSCLHGLLFGRDVLEAVDSFVSVEDAHFSTRALEIFDRIMRSNARVGMTLRHMNDHGVLGLLLPEFGELVHFFQHNIYHYYTADEHTLIALERCEALASDHSFLGNLYSACSDKSLLYYSILLHDIGKPVDIRQHDRIGEQIANAVLERVGRQDIASDVSFAVRHHLLTEKTAFRRDIRDHATIHSYIQTVGTLARLDLLQLLAYADLSALNPSVWTDWKGAILQELHEAARAALMGVKFIDRQGTDKPESVSTRISSQNITREDREAIKWEGDKPMHQEEQEANDAVAAGETYRCIFKRDSSHTTVTVITRDAPYLLSRLAAVFLSSDAAVVDASAATTQEGVAIDTFRLVDIVSGGPLDEIEEQNVIATLDSVLVTRADTEELFRRHREKWKRKLRRAVNPITRTDVVYHQHRSENGRLLTIIDVYAPDTLGLLYRLTQQISLFRLSILTAKIASRVDGVIDSFYVVDMNGEALASRSLQNELRAALLHQIHILTATPGL
jgi:[protein-PII] uridylyltransferase